MPLYLVSWLRSIKPVFPAALCRATSDSWITSWASVTPSLQFTSVRTTLVRSPHTLETFTLWSNQDTKIWGEYWHLPAHKQLTSSEFPFFSHLCFTACFLFGFALFVGGSLILHCSHLQSPFSSAGVPFTSSPSRSSPTCSGNNGCQPAETNSACKQRVQLDRKGASAFLFSSLHEFMVAFGRCSLSCIYINAVSYWITFIIFSAHAHVLWLNCASCTVDGW